MLRSTLYFSIFIHFFMMLTPLTAFALSCAIPVLNEEAVANADVIFEGTALSERDLSTKEKIKYHGLSSKGGDLGDMRVYEFNVSRNWKNTQKGNVVQILRSVYWGDSFSLNDVPYFVVGNDKNSDFYFAHLCGHTMPLEYYQDDSPIEHLRGQLDILPELLNDEIYTKKDY